jgi:hypothetical protein
VINCLGVGQRVAPLARRVEDEGGEPRGGVPEREVPGAGQLDVPDLRGHRAVDPGLLRRRGELSRQVGPWPAAEGVEPVWPAIAGAGFVVCTRVVRR